MTPEVRFRLEDMDHYAEEALALLGSATLAEVMADRPLELALTYLVQVVGEAAFRIPAEFREQHPKIAWRQAIGQRHIIVHGYGKVLTEVIVATVRDDFPVLISQLKSLLAEIHTT
jgi:uncharacterized protein with HEPN domain